MKRLTVDQTACVLAVMLKRSDQTRARISEKTLRLVSHRSSLRLAFLSELKVALDAYGWILVDLEIGGFGVVQAKALEAAKAVTAKRWLSSDDKAELAKKDPDFTVFEDELWPGGANDADDE